VHESHLQVVWIIFLFMIFRIFSPDFSSVSLEKFFFDSCHGFGCQDEPHHLARTLM
jgi:hypothetical protein